MVKNPPDSARDIREAGSISWVRKVPWRRGIPWTEECDRLQSTGSQRVGHN